MLARRQALAARQAREAQELRAAVERQEQLPREARAQTERQAQKRDQPAPWGSRVAKLQEIMRVRGEIEARKRERGDRG